MLNFSIAQRFSSITDTVPTERDLRMLVAEKVTDFQSLGMMLDMDCCQIEIFTKDERRTVLLNMKILTTWISSETKAPTTWHTLLQALVEMEEKKLARDITNELEQRALGKYIVVLSFPAHFFLPSIFTVCPHVVLYFCKAPPTLYGTFIPWQPILSKAPLSEHIVKTR